MRGSRVVVSASKSGTRFRMLRARRGQGEVLAAWRSVSLFVTSVQHIFLCSQDKYRLVGWPATANPSQLGLLRSEEEQM